jgi:hypothetical protein
MASLPKDRATTIPVRSFAVRMMPGAVEVAPAPCPRPDFLAGDDTAFAFFMHDASLAPVLKVGTVMYCSKLRDPAAGDIVVLVTKKGPAAVGVMTDASEDGYELVTTHQHKDGSWRTAKDLFPFEDLTEVAVVVATRRSVI